MPAARVSWGRGGLRRVPRVAQGGVLRRGWGPVRHPARQREGLRGRPTPPPPPPWPSSSSSVPRRVLFQVARAGVRLSFSLRPRRLPRQPVEDVLFCFVYVFVGGRGEAVGPRRVAAVGTFSRKGGERLPLWVVGPSVWSRDLLLTRLCSLESAHTEAAALPGMARSLALSAISAPMPRRRRPHLFSWNALWRRRAPSFVADARAQQQQPSACPPTRPPRTHERPRERLTRRSSSPSSALAGASPPRSTRRTPRLFTAAAAPGVPPLLFLRRATSRLQYCSASIPSLALLADLLLGEAERGEGSVRESAGGRDRLRAGPFTGGRGCHDPSRPFPAPRGFVEGSAWAARKPRETLPA